MQMNFIGGRAAVSLASSLIAEVLSIRLLYSESARHSITRIESIQMGCGKIWNEQASFLENMLTL